MPEPKRDKPIIFSAPMVRALLEGRKTQTRRVLKPQPKIFPNARPFYRPHPNTDPHLWCCLLGEYVHNWQTVPYAPGDRLWVREAWRSKCGEAHPECVIYRATDEDRMRDLLNGSARFKPSIHMPRWASRLTLSVTDVRVQRLQEISCADAIAEGIRPAANSLTIDCDTPDPRHEFRALWNGIHGDKPGRRWVDNPWICALTFDVHHGNIDELANSEARRG